MRRLHHIDAYHRTTPGALATYLSPTLLASLRPRTRSHQGSNRNVFPPLNCAPELLYALTCTVSRPPDVSSRRRPLRTYELRPSSMPQRSFLQHAQTISLTHTAHTVSVPSAVRAPRRVPDSGRAHSTAQHATHLPLSLPLPLPLPPLPSPTYLSTCLPTCLPAYHLSNKRTITSSMGTSLLTQQRTHRLLATSLRCSDRILVEYRELTNEI